MAIVRNRPPRPRLWTNLAVALLVFFALTFVYSLVAQNQSPQETVALSQLAQDINAGKISKIVESGNSLDITYVGQQATKTAQMEDGTALSQSLVNFGVDKAKLAAVDVEVQTPSGFTYVFVNYIAPFILPLVLIMVFIWLLTRQVRGAGMQAFSFGQSKARVITPDDKRQRVTFKNVAGVKEAKEELTEVVDFLRNPRKFFEIGARIPKGILLMGAPGTGKTLLARAVAGEAGVSFFSISGSEFVEMFVGVGASRVRDLFKVAKQVAPAIIFIDEIDAVGRVRGTGMGGGNDEREQTLNQILVELDGFEPTEKVIVMAATNRPDVLDPALSRPGRFDRRVVLDLPDRNDREDILKIHAKGKPFAEDVNLRVIAERTPGFSGADLYSLMNEGAILAARENRTKVAQFDLIRAIEKVMLGPERKSHLLSTREKKITAYHEAGHALVSSVLPNADPVHKISIIARGRAGGYTLKLPFEDRKLQSRKEFLDDIAVSLGGYAAEETVFGDITTGPASDLQVATALAREMVTKYGMSEKLGPVALETVAGTPLYGKLPWSEKEYSEHVGAQIDDEVSRIINGAMKKAKDIVTKQKKALDTIALRLIEVETVEREDFEKLLVASGIVPKKREDSAA